MANLLKAQIIACEPLTEKQRRFAEILCEEVEKRTGVRLPIAPAAQPGRPAITLSVNGAGTADWADLAQPAAEGYRLGISDDGVWIDGADTRGLLYGIGKLLRVSRLKQGEFTAPDGLRLSESPRFALRGHQLGYRPKTNAYDAWTPEIYAQYIRELALFGANSIEFVPPRTDDDETGPHLKYDPLFMLNHVSRVCDSLDLDVWLWYPNIGAPDTWYPDSGNDKEFMKPDNLKANLAERAEVFAAMPRLDHLMIPGGDPGGLTAQDLFDFSELEAELLHKTHPNAKIWIAPQAFNPTDEWLDTFFENVRRLPAWLGGMVFAPWEKYSLPKLRELTPPSLPIRLYPDITHSTHCQFVIPNWDTAFALTLGRECINPRPVAEKHIHNWLIQTDVVGSLSYSEGINDDVNKFVWSGQDWNPETPVEQTVREYVRFFLSPDVEDSVTEGIFELERHFEGPLLANPQIEKTLARFLELERAADEGLQNNYRFEMCLLRACFDAYIKARLVHETALTARAEELLRGEGTAEERMARAEAALREKTERPVAVNLREKCLALADRLFAHIGSQLTTKKHLALNTERGAFLDNLDLWVTDGGMYLAAFERIRALPDEAECAAALNRLLTRTDAGADGFYDSFGVGGGASLERIVFQHDWADDPGALETPLIIQKPALRYDAARFHGSEYAAAAGALVKGLDIPPLAWVSGVGIYYDALLEIRYPRIAKGRYTVQITGLWNGGFHLYANGVQIDTTPEMKGPVYAFELTEEMTAAGSLSLVWKQEDDGQQPYIAEILIRRK